MSVWSTSFFFCLFVFLPHLLCVCVCVCVLSLLPLRWILVQPTHLDDGSEGRAVFFSGCRQFARDGQINTALLVADAPILPLCRPLE